MRRRTARLTLSACAALALSAPQHTNAATYHEDFGADTLDERL